MIVCVTQMVGWTFRIYRLFADDTCLFKSSPNFATDLVNVENDLNEIHQWSSKWLVDFNPDKTKLLLFSRRHISSNPVLYLNGARISKESTHKHLGIIFSNKGDWNAHIELIIKKTTNKINILRKLKYILDRKTLDIIYKSYIRPVMEYADIIWGNTSQLNANLLEDLQLACLRIITGLPRGTSHETILVESGYAKLKTRRDQHRIIMFHTIY